MTEREKLVSEIEKIIGKGPLFYLRFCKNEGRANQIVNGELYLNTAETFRKLEEEKQRKGQGDKDELKLNLKVEKVSMFDAETNEWFADFSSGNVCISFKDDDERPIVCFSGVELSDLLLVEYNDEHAVFAFDFSNEIIEYFREEFGEHCVVISSRELLNKVNTYSEENDVDFILGKVIYCIPNSLERMEAFQKASPTRFLYKNLEFSKQNEHRLCLASKIPDDHLIRLGKFKEAVDLETDKINNFAIDIKYTLQEK